MSVPTEGAAAAPLDVLAAFTEALAADPTEAGFEAALAAHPGVFDAALAWLHGRYVRGQRPTHELERGDALPLVLSMALSKMDDAGRARFVDETLFRVFHPDAYRELAPLVRRAFQPDEVGRKMVAAARAGTPAERRNTAELEYYLFGGGADYALSPALQVALDVALADLRGDSSLR